MSSHYYELAPVTEEMRHASAQVINVLLPTQEITQQGSVPWSRLAYITDTFGPRFSGSESLERALDWIKKTAEEEDELMVTEMPVMVPHWVRGKEYAVMREPREKQLHMIGLGMSTGTGGKNVSAEVFVVSDNDELQAGSNCTKAQGKIVLFNTIFTTYGETVLTRYYAGQWAAACGGVGALIRSITPWSMQNPHTGLTFNASVAAAAVTIEDANQMKRMQDRGQRVVVDLFMDGKLLPPSQSRNLLIDLVGSELPDEVVLLSGHGDSWDNAEGAMDDGGGFISAWTAVRTLKLLGIKPKRTIRAVVWVNEENGEKGGKEYARVMNASSALSKHSFMLETDSGAFKPYGIALSCSQNTQGGCAAAKAQLSLIGSELLGGIGSGEVSDNGEGADIAPSCELGVPCIGLNVLDNRLDPRSSNNPCVADARGAWTAPKLLVETSAQYDSLYFFHHHSQSDTMETIDPRQLQHMSASLAVWAYAVAQLPTLLPRDALPVSITVGGPPIAREKLSLENILTIVITLFLFGCLALLLCSRICTHLNRPRRGGGGEEGIGNNNSSGNNSSGIALSSSTETYSKLHGTGLGDSDHPLHEAEDEDKDERVHRL